LVFLCLIILVCVSMLLLSLISDIDILDRTLILTCRYL
jgi:hypothetical protein